MTAASVSILIPCLNAEPFLAETIDSALSQTLPPREVIVVDDGSTDRSRAIAERYAPRVSVVSNPGKGASAARNHASALAGGEFFQYLDADDLLEPHALQSRVDALERGGRADVAISDWQRLVDRDGAWGAGRRESGRLPDTGEPADLAVLRGFWAPPAAILYRRTLVERIGGWRESLPVIQDARFLFDAARLGGGIAYVTGVGARYRQHRHTSLSNVGTARFWQDVLQNTREVEAVWTQCGTLDAARRAALAEAYAGCARVGFVADRGLFDVSLDELRRFAEVPLPKFVRAARWLNRVAGYRTARAVMASFCPRDFRQAEGRA